MREEMEQAFEGRLSLVDEKVNCDRSSIVVTLGGL